MINSTIDPSLERLQAKYDYKQNMTCVLKKFAWKIILKVQLNGLLYATYSISSATNSPTRPAMQTFSSKSETTNSEKKFKHW